MDKIDDPETAMRFVRHHGYLNEFRTPADSWFEVGEEPMRRDEVFGRLIEDQTAEILIEQGKVVEVSEGRLPNDSSTWVTCYQPA